jgi:predicted dehydrogenase
LTTLRIGIAGCGRIVRLVHLKALEADPRVSVVAIADPDRAAQSFVAEHAPRAKYFASADDMLTTAELDAVVIAVPPPLHLPVAQAAFARKLHAYVEKPIAPSIDDGEAIISAWREAGTVAQIGFNCRFNDLYRQMKSAIASGAIGDPIATRSALTAHWPAQAPWRVSPSHGGGAMLELSSHHIDLLRFLFDAEIQDTSATTWSNRGDDEAAMLQCTMTNGVHSQILVCYGTVEEDRFEVYGSDGKLVIDRYNSLVVETVPARAGGGIATSLRRTSRELAALPYGLAKRRAPGQEPSFSASLSAFVSCVAEGRAASPSLDDGLASLRVIDAARRQGRPRAV